MTNEIKPKLRREASVSFHHAIVEASHNAIEKVKESEYPFQSCINCLHFSKDEICKVYKQRPPAKVIVYGCPSYADEDEIPF